MPRIVALWGCIAFVFVLLRRESKESDGVTNYLWVPTIWFIMTSSKPLALWFSVGGRTNEEGSPLDEVFLMVLFMIAIVTMIKRRFAWSVVIHEYFWLAMLLAIMFFSAVWSEIPFISARRWFREGVIPVTMCLSVLSEPSPRASVESLIRRAIYVCIPFSYLLIHYYPEYGRIYVHRQGIEMWTGVTGHKNQLAALCLTSFLYNAWRIAVRKTNSIQLQSGKLSLYFDIVILLITLVTFMGPNRSLTYSATTLLSTIGGLGVLGFLRWHWRRGTQPASFLITSLSAFLICYGTVTPFIGKLTLFDVSGAVGRSENLTGRGDIWQSLLPAVSEQPVLGSGFGAFWSDDAREKYDISDSHNGYLGVILETGFVGLICYAIFLLSATITAHRLLGSNYYWGALCLMFTVSMLLHNIGEASLTSFSTQLTAVFLLLILSCWRGGSTITNPEFETGRTADSSSEEQLCAD